MMKKEKKKNKDLKMKLIHYNDVMMMNHGKEKVMRQRKMEKQYYWVNIITCLMD